MADRTEIAWCDSTFNPWIGCTKVGPGCDHCYAEADFDFRKHRVKWGSGNSRSRTSEANWKKPLQWNRQPFVECMACGWRGELREAEIVKNPPGFHPPVDSASLCKLCRQPMLKSSRRRVFCASLADVFDNEVPRQWRYDLLWLISNTPNLNWLVLTKRIGNAHRMLSDECSRMGLPWDPKRWPHVWIGATICNQEEADRDIPKLLAIRATVRWISVEPLLGKVELDSSDAIGLHAFGCGHRGCECGDRGIDWVVAGGESGAKARPMHPGWVRSLRDQCAAAGVPFFMKQLSGERGKPIKDITAFPSDLQIREYPHANP